MRKNNNTNNISTIIKRLMKNPKLSKRLENLDILEIWGRAIGTQLQKYIIESRVVNNNLIVKVNSSTLRHELSYKKTELIEEINNEIGKDVIQDIILK